MVKVTELESDDQTGKMHTVTAPAKHVSDPDECGHMLFTACIL